MQRHIQQFFMFLFPHKKKKNLFLNIFQGQFIVFKEIIRYPFNINLIWVPEAINI